MEPGGERPLPRATPRLLRNRPDACFDPRIVLGPGERLPFTFGDRSIEAALPDELGAQGLQRVIVSVQAAIEIVCRSPMHLKQALSSASASFEPGHSPGHECCATRLAASHDQLFGTVRKHRSVCTVRTQLCLRV